jgi:hypothetical protein
MLLIGLFQSRKMICDYQIESMVGFPVDVLFSLGIDRTIRDSVGENPD